VVSFSDGDIRAIVETGELTDKIAEGYLIDVLIKRRDKIGRYWLSRINPIDKFTVKNSGGMLRLSFADLGLENNIFNEIQTYYEFSVYEANEDVLLKNGRVQTPDLSIRRSRLPADSSAEKPVILRFEIRTHRKDARVSNKPTRVFIALEDSSPRIVGIQRD